jgi:hypothetical protein
MRSEKEPSRKPKRTSNAIFQFPVCFNPFKPKYIRSKMSARSRMAVVEDDVGSHQSLALC